MVRKAQQAKNREARRAFTLIELMVLAGIIAVMLAVLAPVLAQAREQVRSYTCLSNLRQISLASTLYLQDYDEQYASPLPSFTELLPDLHQPYIKQWHAWICPSDKNARMWDGDVESATFLVRTSYVWNAYVFQGDSYDWRRAIYSSAISYPAMLPLWTEGYANAGWVNEGAPMSDPFPNAANIHNAYGDNLNASSKDPTAGYCPVHHDEHLDVAHHLGGNYAFADGHARWLKPSAFTTAPIVANGGDPVDDRSDPMVTNGARYAASQIACPVFCCPQNIGTPPADGERPWFRP